MAKIINRVFSYFSKLGNKNTINKEDVLTLLDTMQINVTTEIIPLLTKFSNNNIKNDVNTNVGLSNIVMFLDLKVRDNQKGLDLMNNTFTNIEKTLPMLNELILNDMSDVNTNRSSTLKDAAIVQVVQDINYLILFIPSLMYYLFKDNKIEHYIPPIEFKEISNDIPYFTNLFKYYYNNPLQVVIERIKLLPIVEIDPSNTSDLINIYLNKNKLNVPVTRENFLGNPIYTIRTWLLEKDIEKYKRMKTEVRLLEARLLDLLSKQNNEGSNDKIIKQIHYYENTIAEINYKIKKFEED